MFQVDKEVDSLTLAGYRSSWLNGIQGTARIWIALSNCCSCRSDKVCKCCVRHREKLRDYIELMAEDEIIEQFKLNKGFKLTAHELFGDTSRIAFYHLIKFQHRQVNIHVAQSLFELLTRVDSFQFLFYFLDVLGFS